MDRTGILSRSYIVCVSVMINDRTQHRKSTNILQISFIKMLNRNTSVYRNLLYTVYGIPHTVQTLLLDCVALFFPSHFPSLSILSYPTQTPAPPQPIHSVSANLFSFLPFSTLVFSSSPSSLFSSILYVSSFFLLPFPTHTPTYPLP